MLRSAEVETEADVDQGIGSVGRQEDPELVDEPAGRHGSELHADPSAVGDDPFVAPDRHGVAGAIDRGCTGDVVEVGVDHRDDGCGGLLAHGIERPPHLLDRLAGVDGDEAVGAFDKVLVR